MYLTSIFLFNTFDKIAIQKGYKERQSECLSSSVYSVINLSSCVFSIHSDKLWIESHKPYKLNCIFNNGKWADFIKETDSEKIERLEKRVKALENKNK